MSTIPEGISLTARMSFCRVHNRRINFYSVAGAVCRHAASDILMRSPANNIARATRNIGGRRAPYDYLENTSTGRIANGNEFSPAA